MPNQDDIREPVVMIDHSSSSSSSSSSMRTTTDNRAGFEAPPDGLFTNADLNAGMDEILAIDTDDSIWVAVTRTAVRDFHVDAVGAADTVQAFAQLVRAAAMKEPDRDAAHELASLAGILRGIENNLREAIKFALKLTGE